MSFHGKVVGGVASTARQHEKRVFVVCGEATASACARAKREGLTVVSLRETFGDEALSSTRRCIEHAVEQLLAEL
jgi:glycerate kinase